MFLVSQFVNGDVLAQINQGAIPSIVNLVLDKQETQELSCEFTIKPSSPVVSSIVVTGESVLAVVNYNVLNLPKGN